MRHLVAALAVLAMPTLTAAAPTMAPTMAPTVADPGSAAVTVTVAVNGQPIDGNAVPIDLDQPVSLLITAANNEQGPLHVQTIRFAGGVLGLSFFGYDTAVPFDVPPHGSVTRTLVLDLGGLRGQAIGLMPAAVDLLDAGGTSLGGVDTVADVNGSIVSLYGALGLVLLVFAAAAWFSAGRAVRGRTRGERRWGAVGRFLPAGIGTGLLAVVWLSIFRLVAPHPLVALGFVLGGVVVALAAGAVATRPEPDLEPLTAIVDPTVGVKTGVLEPITDDPDDPDDPDDSDDDLDETHSGELDTDIDPGEFPAAPWNDTLADSMIDPPADPSDSPDSPDSPDEADDADVEDREESTKA